MSSCSPVQVIADLNEEEAKIPAGKYMFFDRMLSSSAGQSCADATPPWPVDWTGARHQQGQCRTQAPITQSCSFLQPQRYRGLAEAQHAETINQDELGNFNLTEEEEVLIVRFMQALSVGRISSPKMK